MHGGHCSTVTLPPAPPYTAAMKTRDFNPARLDVAKLAHKQAEISGQHNQEAHVRLLELQVTNNEGATRSVSWSARGELRPVRGGHAQIWMHLRARTVATLQCQRCLEATDFVLDIERSFRFVAHEATAASLDAELDDADVLVADGALDLLALIEDEFLLALPIVPMHDTCPVAVNFDRGAALPSGARVDDLAAAAVANSPSARNHNEDGAPDSDHPFAALAALKRRGSGS
ncbi:MAG: hypothetical protein RIQ60_2837 [Pseudomonadota bacterium]|jgi:uncharacterized protein